MKRHLSPGIAGVAAVASLLSAGPLLVLFIEVPWSEVSASLTRSASLSALRVSLATATFAALISVIFGVPLAWVLSRGPRRLSSILRPLVIAPMILPPTVAGFALLNVFGRNGLIGGPLRDLTGATVPFTPAAVVIAGVFVSMPFLVLVVLAALNQLPHEIEEAAAIDGASATQAFWHIVLPYGRSAIAIGAALAWTRALGEFGATLTFAGSLPNVTRTVPMQVYLDLESSPSAAYALSVITLVIAVLVIFSMRIPWVSSLLRARG